jgi:hypothetical protein
MSHFHPHDNTDIFLAVEALLGGDNRQGIRETYPAYFQPFRKSLARLFVSPA